MRNRFFIVYGVVAMFIGIVAIFCVRELGSFRQPISLINATPAYYGLYRCADTDPGADTSLLKLDAKGFSNIELQNAFDDPATGKETHPDINIVNLKVEDAFVRMEGTIRYTDTATFTTTGDSPDKPKPETTTSTREGEFTLDWQSGKEGRPDTVVLTLHDNDSDTKSIHFERKL